MFGHLFGTNDRKRLGTRYACLRLRAYLTDGCVSSPRPFRRTFERKLGQFDRRIRIRTSVANATFACEALRRRIVGRSATRTTPVRPVKRNFDRLPVSRVTREQCLSMEGNSELDRDSRYRSRSRARDSDFVSQVTRIRISFSLRCSNLFFSRFCVFRKRSLSSMTDSHRAIPSAKRRRAFFLESASFEHAKVLQSQYRRETGGLGKF